MEKSIQNEAQEGGLMPEYEMDYGTFKIKKKAKDLKHLRRWLKVYGETHADLIRIRKVL